jgi:hypothetical protein
VAFFSLSYIFVEKNTFSEDENRVLQSLPRFTFEKLLNGTYTRQLHDYFSDHINLRSWMIKSKANTELLMGKNENNGVLLGKDGYLIETHQYTDDNFAFLRKNLYKIEKMSQSLETDGIKINSVIIPRKVDVLQDKFPPYYSDERNQTAWDTVGEMHKDLRHSFTQRHKDGIQIFYKTDHHWTAEGAYYAYREVAEILGFIPYSMDKFNLETLSNDFFGTTYSKSGFFFADSEEIKAPRIENGRYKVTIMDTNTEFDTLYDTFYLAKKDKYSTFLSGNNAHVKIYDTQNQEKETLLIIKDSFSHSLAPYLCEHYNIELIDPRYYNGSIEDYIRENNIKNVLFLFGLDTLASANLIIR